jgi:outer membrane immunogenic protein
MGGILQVRRLALLAAGAIATLFGAEARADGPSVSPLDWSGFYAGAQLGGARSDLDWRYDNANYFNTLGPVVAGSEFSQHPGGVIGGVLGGYNYQTGPWVLGVELTASAANLNEERPSPLFPKLDATTSEVQWLASATGRLGYAWDRWLAFVKGGWAGANVKLSLVDQSAAVFGSKTQWANGWTVGGGAEYMICDYVSLGVAYDFSDINVDGMTVTCPSCNGPAGAGFGVPVVDSDVKIQSVMGRLTFHQ